MKEREKERECDIVRYSEKGRVNVKNVLDIDSCSQRKKTNASKAEIKSVMSDI